jgi:hypothetical protein
MNIPVNEQETVINFTRGWVGGDAEDTDAEFQRIIRERLGDDAEDVYKALKDYWLDFYGYNLREEDNAEAESWRNQR